MTIDTSKLKRYKPGYVHSNDGPGYLSMLARDDGEYVRLEDVKAISSALEQALTQQQATPQPSADAVREIYDAAAKGFHTSETNGAERKYLHVIRFQSIEDLHGYEDAWTAAMVKARDAK